MFCENIVTLVGWMCKSYSILVCSICTVHVFKKYIYIYVLFIFFSFLFFFFLFSRHWFVLFFLFLKRANKLMNGVMNIIFGLVTCLPSPPPLFFSSSPTWFEFFFFFFKWIFICLLCTYNVSLHCIHRKSSKYYIHLISSWTIFLV